MTVRIKVGVSVGPIEQSTESPSPRAASEATTPTSVLDVLEKAGGRARKPAPPTNALSEPAVAELLANAPTVTKPLLQAASERLSGPRSASVIGRIQTEVLASPLLARFDLPSQREIVRAIADRDVLGLGMWAALQTLPEPLATLFARELVRWPLDENEVFLEWIFFVRDVHVAASLQPQQLEALLQPSREAVGSGTAALVTRQLHDALLALDDLQSAARPGYLALLDRLWLTSDSGPRVQALVEQCAATEAAIASFYAATPPVLDQVGEWLAQRPAPVSQQELARLLADAEASLAR